ncbi:MAG: tetratricopeptide repeat protein [Marinilabiliaceae bacterium]
MFESWSAHFNEVKEAVERFEKMEYSGREIFFDVHSIENIFDFYVDKLQFNKAERIIEIGLRQHPGANNLRIKQAIIFIENGKMSRAATQLEELLLLEKSNPEIYLNLGYIYLHQGENKRGLRVFEEGLKHAFNEEPELLLDVALYTNQFKEFDATIDILGSRYQQIQSNENLLFELAYALDQEGQDTRAYAVYQDLLDQNPFSDNAWYNAGISHVKMGNLEKANEAFDFCLAVNPAHSQAHFNKGNSLAQLNKYKEALDSYLECISYDIQQSRCLHYIADCWNQLGNSGNAVKFYRLAVESDFLDFDAWEGFARYHLDNHESELCREIIGQAMMEKELMTDEETGIFHHLKAQSYVLDEEWDLSKKFFKRAALSNRRDFRHLLALYKLNKALTPDYNIQVFVEEHFKQFIETGSFQYMLAAFHFLIDENMEKGIHHLEQAGIYAPGFIPEFLDTFPQILNLAKNNEKLAQLTNQNNGNNEL